MNKDIAKALTIIIKNTKAELEDFLNGTFYNIDGTKRNGPEEHPLELEQLKICVQALEALKSVTEP